MKILSREDLIQIEQQVLPWLEKRGIPVTNFRNLKTVYKLLLHELLCMEDHIPASDMQLRELYKNLALGETKTEGHDNAVDKMENDELKKFFSPLTPSEKLRDYQMY